MALPQKMYFSFKFFSFKEIQTDTVIMRLPPELQNDPNHIHSRMLLNQHYYLIKLKHLQQQQKGLQAETQQNLEIIFDIDPSMSEILDEPLLLSNYLRDKVLTVDVWDGDSLMHFGCAKVPLYRVMRQGKSTNTQAIELDVCDPEHGQYLGGLQMLISNEGRKIPDEVMNQIAAKHTKNLTFVGAQTATSPMKNSFARDTGSPSRISPSKHKKKVLSKPLEVSNLQVN